MANESNTATSSTDVNPSPPFDTLDIPTSVPILTNVRNHVQIELTYFNYLSWKKMIITFLDCQEVLGIVNGDIPSPSPAHPQFKMWIRCDKIAHSWINSSLSSSVLETLLNYSCKSANAAWLQLNQLFLDNVSATQMQIRAKFFNFKLEDKSMNDFLQQIHSLFSSLIAVGENIIDRDLVAQTLLGLPASYDPFITCINAANPRPNFATIRQLLLNEEERVKHSQKIASSSSSSLLLYSDSHKSGHSTSKSISPKFKPRFHNKSKPSPHTPFKPSSTTHSGILGSAPHSIKQLCQICGKGYHSALNCSNRFNHAFTSSKLQQSLSAMQLSHDTDDTIWYPDSGASSHMTGNSSLLHSLVPYHGSTHVMIGNGALLSITHIGQATISGSSCSLHLKNVFYIPSLTKNLISIHKLCLDNDCLVEFSPSLFTVKDQQTQTTLHQSSNQGSLYPFSPSLPKAFSSISCSAPTS